MEIEFNPNQVSSTRVMNPIRRPGSGLTPVSEAVVSDASVRKLQANLSKLPELRVDKVAEAKALLSDPGYPPDYLFDRISTLLAIHLGS